MSTAIYSSDALKQSRLHVYLVHQRTLLIPLLVTTHTRGIAICRPNSLGTCCPPPPENIGYQNTISLRQLQSKETILLLMHLL